MIIDFLYALFFAFGLVFVAELGDKTQLIILTLAMKGHSPKKLALGAVCGFAVIVFLGGLISILLCNLIDLKWLTLVSGIFFVIIGIYQIGVLIKNRNKKQCDDSEIEGQQDCIKAKETKNSFLAGFLAIITMEMGDKTQVMTILIAATSQSFVGTLFGSWMALSSLAIIGAFAGEWLSKKVPKDKMDWIAALLFAVIGLVVLITAI